MFRKLILTAAVAALTATAATAGDPFTNGSLDPFNKNNSLGGSIKTPFGKKENDGSRLAVQTKKLDPDGNFVEESPYGRQTRLGPRGELKRDSKTGKACWLYVTPGGERYTSWAAPKWQAVLEQQEKDQAVQQQMSLVRQQQAVQAQQQAAIRQQQLAREQLGRDIILRQLQETKRALDEASQRR